jgi:hypothetical protein
MNEFIEQQIITAVRGLLAGRVNELLSDLQFVIPLVEFENYASDTAVVPVISLASCERTEKERIILLDAYSLTVTFYVPETPECELFCYAYAAAVCKALQENPTLSGIVDRVTVSGKKYAPPKKPDCGQGWELVITLRVTVESQVIINR